jgi:hypothetical protein
MARLVRGRVVSEVRLQYFTTLTSINHEAVEHVI